MTNVIEFQPNEKLNQINQDINLMTEFNLLKRRLTDREYLNAHKVGKKKSYTFSDQRGAFVYILVSESCNACTNKYMYVFAVENILSQEDLEAINNHGNFVPQISCFFSILGDGIDTASRIDFLTKVIAAILMLLSVWIGTVKIFDEDMGGKENNSPSIEQQESK